MSFECTLSNNRLVLIMASKRLKSALTLIAVLASLVNDVRGTWEEDVISRLDKLDMASYSLIRQTMLQQFAMEESTRSSGDSGVKQVRVTNDGTKAYFTATHATHAAAAIHDHTDNIRTCGMGEIEAVLNGVQFRSRHNDYALVMPSNTSGEYHKTEPIPYPAVPPAVLQAGDVVKQIREMRSWFRAWREQNYTVRDYRPYFKPVLCYLEGAWTNNENLDEPFESTRHHLDAANWFDLQEKARFTAYTGDKDPSENYAYLPTNIMNITDGQPVLAQWNYRILCHPIQHDLLDLQHLKLVDDLSSRLRLNKDIEGYEERRAARFFITEHDQDRPDSQGRTLLDRLMMQVPGKDNYMGNIEDSALGMTKYNHLEPDQVLNAAYYHRWFRIGTKDAMGVSIIHNGFADRNLYVSRTTQERVVPVEVEICKTKDDCATYSKRVTYAIPLEVVWMTPLNTWNPYDLEYKGDRKSSAAATVTADGRNGGFTVDKALNGTNEINYMLTPSEFFTGQEVNPNEADTVRNSIGVLDKNGTVRVVSSSGIRIVLPPIVDVPVRTRYPVFPIHAEGDTTFKEVEALQKIVMDLQANAHYLHAMPNFGSVTPSPVTPPPFYTLVTSASDAQEGQHVHRVDLQRDRVVKIMNGEIYEVIRTTMENAHTHLLNVTFNSDTKEFYYITCDGKAKCWDNHSTTLFHVSD